MLSTTDKKEKRDYDRPEIRLPSWMVALLVSLLLQGITIVFMSGQVWSRVASLERRIDNLENRINYIFDKKLP